MHGTGIFGRIGAAAAGATLLRLDATRSQHALALAATQAGGLTGSFGTMAKPFHAGKAAMDGVLAAQLASRGFEGAPAVLETGGGLVRALIQDGEVPLGSAQRDGWAILENSFKPYAACHLVHPAVDAMRKLSPDPASIRAVRVHVSPLAMQITGGASGQPDSPLAAKFDLKYCLAAALHGAPLSARDFLEPWRPNAATLATAAKITPAADASVGFASARAEIDLASGETRGIVIPVGKGHPGNPMTWDDLWSKFDGLVAVHLGPAARPLFDHARSFGNGPQTHADMRRMLAKLPTPTGPRASMH